MTDFLCKKYTISSLWPIFGTVHLNFPEAIADYADAIERVFGSEVDYGTVIKIFTHTDWEATRHYSPPSVLKVKKMPVQGLPDISPQTDLFVLSLPAPNEDEQVPLLESEA